MVGLTPTRMIDADAAASAFAVGCCSSAMVVTPSSSASSRGLGAGAIRSDHSATGETGANEPLQDRAAHRSSAEDRDRGKRGALGRSHPHIL